LFHVEKGIRCGARAGGWGADGGHSRLTGNAYDEEGTGEQDSNSFLESKRDTRCGGLGDDYHAAATRAAKMEWIPSTWKEILTPRRTPHREQTIPSPWVFSRLEHTIQRYGVLLRRGIGDRASLLSENRRPSFFGRQDQPPVAGFMGEDDKR